MTEQTERVPRPEEVLKGQEDLTPEQKIRPLRCRAGSGTDNPCPREATTWMHPEDRDYPLCDEHARAIELGREVSHWALAEEVTGGWLRLAHAWKHEDLERLATNAHEEAKQELLRAEARSALAEEIADVPRKGNERPDLTREQDEELRRLMRRSDELTNAYTTIEDVPEGQIEEDVRRRILAVLVEEQKLAEEECNHYREEIGHRPR